MLVNYFEDDIDYSQPILWILVISPILGAFLQVYCNVIMAKDATRARAVLINSIYHKIFLLSPMAKESFSTGQIIILFSEDVNQLFQAYLNLHRTLGELLDVVACVYLMYYQVGLCASLAIIYAILAIVISKISLKQLINLRQKKLFFTELRCRLTNELLNGIRIIRLYGWENIYFKKIIDARQQEMEYLWWIGSIYNTIVVWLLTSGPLLQSVIIFSVCIYTGHTLTVAKAFSMLTLFSVLSSSLTFLSSGFHYLSQSLVASKRIIAFLRADELQLYIRYHDDDGNSAVDDHLWSGPISQENVGRSKYSTHTIAPTVMTNVAIVWNEVSLGWRQYGKVIGKLSSGEAHTKSIKSTNRKPSVYNTFHQSVIQDPKDEEVDEHSGLLASTIMDPHRKISVKNVSITICKGELIALIGPVGCGKTSLILSLLEDINLLSGSISMAKSLQNNLAYCEQSPWVVSGTIRDNILLCSTKPFSQVNLDRAVAASALYQDLKELESGLHTVVGERGKTLSGGQRARVSFARALYSNASLFVLDDILCAVDAHIALHMFQEGVVKMLKGCTRLMVTNQANVLPYCDKIIALDISGELTFLAHSQSMHCSFISQAAAILAMKNPLKMRSIVNRTHLQFLLKALRRINRMITQCLLMISRR
jgi:ABC-type multidrug transport system fused ATPase/permease subunit